MFNEDSLPKRSLETYYQVLNIIGKRLSETKSKITISGASDGKEMSSNKERSEIALSRAKSISNYLINEWGLDPKRITLKSLKTPTYPTNYDYSEGDVENRRVEITSDYEDLLKPIVFERFIERSIEPKEIKFNTSVTSESKIKNWALRMTIKNEIVWEQIGEGNPPSDVVCSLDLIKAKEFTNEDSMSNVSISSIPVTRGLSPLELSRLSLIVFDFDRDNVTKSNKKMITGFVSNSISANSDIEIKGSTDKLGEAEHNKELSESRAFAVRDLIKKEKRDAKSIIAKGIGSDELLYDNLIPEGRFYCRTVRVQVSMPLRKQGIK
jgi:outer membrane protein OmpA-like peptidoglycan-associated protein